MYSSVPSLAIRKTGLGFSDGNFDRSWITSFARLDARRVDFIVIVQISAAPFTTVYHELTKLTKVI
jgi:hypothetical protein